MTYRYVHIKCKVWTIKFPNKYSELKNVNERKYQSKKTMF